MGIGLVKNAARGGAVAACAVSLAINGDKFSKGELDFKAAARKTAIDTAAGAATGALTGGLAALLSRAAPNLLRGGTGTLAIAATTVEVGVDAVRLARGKIDRGQFARRSAINVAKSTAAWAAAKAAALVCAPLGPIGAGVGGLFGGLIGWVAVSRMIGQPQLPPPRS